MTEKKTPKVEFAPGCFDQFDGTQEELDELVAKIQEMAESGELVENAVLLEDCIDDLSEEELAELFSQLPSEYDGPQTRH